MQTSLDLQRQVQADLAKSGLKTLGWFAEENGRPALLIGNFGGSHWKAFRSSKFYNDGQNDPMNRWTRSTLSPITEKYSCEVRYPFGEQLWPFQRWAAAATGMKPSPIGLFIHPNYGLWVALRGAFVFTYDIELPKSKPSIHPCVTCRDQPCLSSCPVDAFSSGSFDVVSCRQFAGSIEGTSCREGGCKARLSCPVGKEFAYDLEQQTFHMTAFLP